MRVEAARRRVSVLASVSASFLLGACGCPEGDAVAIPSGTYAAIAAGDVREHDDAGSAQGRSVRWVHQGVSGKVIVVDREAGLVRVEYDQGGRRVVETWRVKSAGETNTHFLNARTEGRRWR